MNEKLNELDTRLSNLENNFKFYYHGQIRMFMGMAEPCPHCGSEDLLLSHNINDEKVIYFVMCNVCKATGGAHSIEYDAIIAWNKRRKV